MRIRWHFILAIALGVTAGIYTASCGQDNAPEAYQDGGESPTAQPRGSMGSIVPLAGDHPTYQNISIAQFPTYASVRHVCTTGTVAMRRREADGDLHYRIVAIYPDRGFIVAEVSPRTPTAFDARVGDMVRVCGTRSYDDGHKWWEVHPVEEGSILKKGSIR
jgi:hypothetical protein